MPFVKPRLGILLTALVACTQKSGVQTGTAAKKCCWDDQGHLTTACLQERSLEQLGLFSSGKLRWGRSHDLVSLSILEGD